MPCGCRTAGKASRSGSRDDPTREMPCLPESLGRSGLVCREEPLLLEVGGLELVLPSRDDAPDLSARRPAPDSRIAVPLVAGRPPRPAGPRPRPGRAARRMLDANARLSCRRLGVASKPNAVLRPSRRRSSFVAYPPASCPTHGLPAPRVASRIRRPAGVGGGSSRGCRRLSGRRGRWCRRSTGGGDRSPHGVAFRPCTWDQGAVAQAATGCTSGAPFLHESRSPTQQSDTRAGRRNAVPSRQGLDNGRLMTEL
ncbi:hypothetical protein OJF2_58430 [Aquisphaera giovannonii]|uniref:Uncharacterized protein n=1 Tax=Aquisphaera giovannonii TaxID=406548 RepID=A0A5B9W9Q4_9BACT|nr:hypothetical protein OJF2_58430 [Aquisphaera giovannonii]